MSTFFIYLYIIKKFLCINKITMKCNQCLSEINIVKNGKRKDRKQNYLCKCCNHQFIKDEDRVYLGKIKYIKGAILRFLGGVALSMMKIQIEEKPRFILSKTISICLTWFSNFLENLQVFLPNLLILCLK